ncbi:hypothetical protein HYPSUDRAFT_196514 [Hypholoma sublateritium FD-334 SS-4]|uniref:Uncharacterized protein n=1 Tax=Hypholoma sublateritium (strain FD-334 SS-4) TaxID=945553 RepID=A0A0D2PL42_HYPSF|nr:hypothetical protein HYPSUDRAFT_196514 [Hypholoma sublateritium FD-334 SS-4]
MDTAATSTDTRQPAPRLRYIAPQHSTMVRCCCHGWVFETVAGPQRNAAAIVAAVTAPTPVPSLWVTRSLITAPPVSPPAGPCAR